MKHTNESHTITFQLISTFSQTFFSVNYALKMPSDYKLNGTSTIIQEWVWATPAIKMAHTWEAQQSLSGWEGMGHQIHMEGDVAGTVKRPSQKSDLDTRKAVIFTSFFVKCIFISFDFFFFNWPLSPFSSRLTGFYILRELLLVCDVNCKYFSVGHCLWHCLLAEMVTFLSINASIFYFSCIFFNGSSVMVGNTLHSEVKNIIVFFCYFI